MDRCRAARHRRGHCVGETKVYQLIGQATEIMHLDYQVAGNTCLPPFGPRSRKRCNHRTCHEDWSSRQRVDRQTPRTVRSIDTPSTLDREPLAGKAVMGNLKSSRQISGLMSRPRHLGRSADNRADSMHTVRPHRGRELVHPYIRPVQPSIPAGLAVRKRHGTG